MPDVFTHENAAYVMDILGSLEQFAGESKTDRNKRKIEHFKTRTTDMAIIVTHAEMGKVCVQYKSVADYHMKKEKACNNPQGCLTCKAFFDTHECQKHPITNATTIGMT
eukprot:6103101-Heterocapsa_arctica.AAC.1